MEIFKISVKLGGLADIMFDRFIDHSKERRPAEQKLYLSEGNRVVLPQDNIIAFLFGDDPPGCAKAFEGKRGKEYIRMGQSHINIQESLISFKAENEEDVVFEGFNGKFWIHSGAPRTKQGSRSIKQEKTDRPVLKLPWSLSFTIIVVKNTLIDETKLYNWFSEGGILLSLGTYRPRFGRFEVSEWEAISGQVEARRGVA